MKLYPWQSDLWRQLMSSRAHLPHALLLQGRAGIGKFALAKGLAKTLLCENAADEQTACGQCTACMWFEQGGHPDFRLLEPAALTQATDAAVEQQDGERSAGKKPSLKITIDQVRELSDFINLTTHRNGLRIVLVHPAESMNLHAANALLKTLEEPPARTLFIMVTHQPQQLLPTIRSRCQAIDMAMPSREAASSWLREQGVAHSELCLAQAGHAPLLAMEFGAADYQEQRQGFLRHLCDPATMDALGVAAKSAKLELGDVVNWLQKWVYDLLSLKLSGRIVYQLDFEGGLLALSRKVSMPRLLSYQQDLLGVKRALSHPLNSQLLLEKLLITYSRISES
jgi:DNA polymerase-3 subunit delta'